MITEQQSIIVERTAENELNKAHERVDPRATCTSSAGDPSVATVGTLDGPTNVGREALQTRRRASRHR